MEIRNKTWLNKRFTDLLGEHGVGLALTDTSFIPRPWELKEKLDLITADFTYVRWLGDRKGIEKQTQTWDKTVVDRSEDLKSLGAAIQAVRFKESQSLQLREQSLRRPRPGDRQALLGFVEKAVT